MNLCPCILNGRASFLSSERVAGSHSRRGLNNIFLEDCFFVDRVWGEAHTVLAHCCFLC